MRMNLFGIGTKSESPAITAQKRINCYVELRKEQDRTAFALVGRPGLISFVSTLGANPSRGLWAVNSLTIPLTFSVNGNTLYSINNAGSPTSLGTIGSSSGNVSMVDDGTFLLIVDGSHGYVYNMATNTGPTLITDGNFTTTPKMCTWQDGYFIVSAGTGRQFQMSQISPSIDPTVWPANQINFAGSGSGSLRACISDHSILNLMGDVYTEFWQDQGTPDFPFALIPGAAQEFGMAASFSLAKFDNSVAGLFNNKMGGVNVSRLQGLNLRRLTDQDMEAIFFGYTQTADATAFSFMNNSHPLYIINFQTMGQSWMYDGSTGAWSQLENATGGRFIGEKFALFQGMALVSDYSTGNVYAFNQNTYTDNGAVVPMEVWSKHIWEDDKYIGISDIQIDVESGVGLVSGQGVNPQMDLQVSKDGGNTFKSVGFSSIGAIGAFTQRVKWHTLGAARDWVLKLVITDPVKRVITGASAEVQKAGH